MLTPGAANRRAKDTAIGPECRVSSSPSSVNGAPHSRFARMRLRRTVGSLCRPSGPDCEGQARNARRIFAGARGSVGGMDNEWTVDRHLLGKPPEVVALYRPLIDEYAYLSPLLPVGVGGSPGGRHDQRDCCRSHGQQRNDAGDLGVTCLGRRPASSTTSPANPKMSCAPVITPLALVASKVPAKEMRRTRGPRSIRTIMPIKTGV